MNKTNNTQQGFAHLWVLLLFVVVVIGAVGVTIAKHNTSKPLNSASETQLASTVKPLPTDLNNVLTVDKVKQIAAEDKPNTAVSQVGLVQSDDGLVFHVELNDGSTLDLDAKTGNKVANAKVSDDALGTEVPANFTPSIDFTKAQQVALAQISGSTITRIELETEEGTPVFSVRFANGARVDVNAATGAVAQVRQASSGKSSSANSSSNSSKSDDKSSTTSGETEKSSSSNNGSNTSESSHGDTTSSGSGSSSTSGSGSGSGSSEGSNSSGSGSSSTSGSGSGSGGHGSDDTSSGSHH